MNDIDLVITDIKSKYPELKPVKRFGDVIEFIGTDFSDKNDGRLPEDVVEYLEKTYSKEYKIDNFYEKEEDTIKRPRLIKKQLSEKKLTKGEKIEKEKIVMGLKGQKKDFAKRYGKKDAESVMYATAAKLAKQVKESDRQKVEEAIANYFEAKTKKYDDNPSLKGKQKTTLPDKLQAAIIKKKGGKVEESDLLFTNDFAKQNQVNYIDDEGRMAKQQLFKIKKYAQELCDMLDDNTQLEGWVQAKITKAEEAIGAVKHYMEYEMFRKQQG
jgi:hypothetical protein